MEENIKTSNVISVKEWVINLIIMCIPIVNIIFLFIWAFGQNDINETKQNWAKASLIIMAIGLVISIIFYVLLAAAGLFFLQQGGYV